MADVPPTHVILFNKCKGAVIISKEYSKGEIESLKTLLVKLDEIKGHFNINMRRSSLFVNKRLT